MQKGLPVNIEAERYVLGAVLLGARLLDAMIARARIMGIRRLYAEVSETARPLFERKGFAMQHRRAFFVRGVEIHNYAMVRQAL